MEQPLETPLGTLWVSCVDGDRVYADANSNGKPGLTLRGGGRFHVTFAIERQPDGSWQVADRIYTSRAWTPGGKGSFDGATKHQIEDIRKKAVPVVIEWAKGQEQALAEAGVEKAQWHYRQAEQALVEANHKVLDAKLAEQAARKALNAAEERLSSLNRL